VLSRPLRQAPPARFWQLLQEKLAIFWGSLRPVDRL